MTRARTLGSLLLVPLSLCARAARAADVGLLDPRPVFVSTVSASEKESINKQIPPNKEFALTDKSLTRSAVGSGYTLIPLPAFVYNRNEGAWIGGLTPVFRANEKGQVEDIYAPLYMHNDLIGETLTFSYFGYRSGTRQYHAILSYATKVERTVDFSYKDTGFGDGSYIVGLQANSGKSAFNRFYGFGQGSSVDAESNYALGDANLVGSGGINLSDELSLVATERLRRVTIGNGVVSRLPQTPAAFPTAPGIEGAKIWGQGLTLTYDTRDNPLTPLEGSFAMVMAESDQNYQSDNRNQWWRTTVEAKNFAPHADDRAVLVTHAVFDLLPIDSKGLVRQGVPFYERPTLGGETTLRGYGRGRFVSSYSVLFNVEERISVIQRSIMGNVVELCVAPFVDMGRVGRVFGYNGVVKNMEIDPGVGVRLLARPNIASRLDIGYGRGGPNVFVGLDYPF